MSAPMPQHRLTADALDYGTVCPDCASPKHRQSKRCAQCYYDALQMLALRDRGCRELVPAACPQPSGESVAARDKADRCQGDTPQSGERTRDVSGQAGRSGDQSPVRSPDTNAAKGRPQPQNHPWRGKNKLLFTKKAA